MRISRLLRWVTISLATSVITATQAQSWPDKPVRWIVGYPAGGGADIVARLVGGHVSQNIGQPVIVDNRPGAAGSIGADLASKAPADGYTFLIADGGTLVHNTALFRKLSYEPAKSFTAVSLFTQTPLMLIAGPAESSKTIQEYVAKVKAQPGQFSIASPGAGAHHFGLEQFKLQAGLPVTTIPYKGAGPAVADVAAGQVPTVVTDPSAAAALLRAGKLRALAVTSQTRLPEYPDVPTVSESVLANFEAYVWVGLVAPASTPPAIITRMHAEIQKALSDPAIIKRFQDFGLSTKLATTTEMTELWRADMKVWPDVIRKLGIVYD